MFDRKLPTHIEYDMSNYTDYWITRRKKEIEENDKKISKLISGTDIHLSENIKVNYTEFQPFIKLTEQADHIEVFILLRDCSYTCKDDLSKDITILYENHTISKSIVGFWFSTEKPSITLPDSIEWFKVIRRFDNLYSLYKENKLTDIHCMNDNNMLKVYRN